MLDLQSSAQSLVIGSHHMTLYRLGERNRCPCCQGEQWIIGRMMAECGQCGSALSLGQFSTYRATPRIERRDYQYVGLPDYLQTVS